MRRNVVLVGLGVACLVAGLAVVAAALLGVVRPGLVAPQIVSDRSPADPASVKPVSSAVDDDRNDVSALSTLMRNGADLTKRTTITHYLYVPELADARAAVAALEPRGFTAVLGRPQTSTNAGVRTDWGVVASRDETPTIEHLRATRAFFKALAVRYHGSYDGWEAAVVR